MADNKNCRTCVYFRGSFDETCTCDYPFMTNKRRPCPPGDGCTVKIKRPRKRKMKSDRQSKEVK